MNVLQLIMLSKLTKQLKLFDYIINDIYIYIYNLQFKKFTQFNQIRIHIFIFIKTSIHYTYLF